MCSAPSTTLHREPLPKQVADLLTEEILAGEFGPGAALPSQAALASRFGVSRIVVREAFNILTAHGLVDVRHGRTAQVRPLDGALLGRYFTIASTQKDAIGHLLEVRRVLELAIVGSAADRADALAIERIERAVTAMELGLDSGETFIDADIEFHAALAAATANPLFVGLIEGLRQPLRASQIVSTQLGHRDDFPTASRRVLGEHRRILAEVARHDAGGAAAAMKDHLINTERDLRAYHGLP